MTDDVVTRGEFDMLRQQVSDNAHRLDAIDVGGTRGVAVLQLQINEQSAKLAQLLARFEKHEIEHEQDARERIRNRRIAWRWGVGLVCGLLGGVEGPLIYLVAQHR